MALWLEPESEALSAEEEADLAAITALKESAAIELKEKGNEYLKMGKKHYHDAVDCYTRAINQKCMDESNTAVLYANRAQVHLLLGNYRRALLDAQEALKLNTANIKACFRGAKAALSLQLFHEAAEFCSCGLEQDPQNEELLKLRESINKKLAEAMQREKEATIAIAKAETLSSALVARKVRIGKPVYKEHTAGRKPWLDKSNILHWPVLLLYGEVMASDFIEDFCEVETFSSHLDIIFGEDAPLLPWDLKHDYTRSTVQLFYKVSAGPSLSRKQVLKYLLEGGNDGEVVDDSDVEIDGSYECEREDAAHSWIKVSETSTLHDVLAKKKYVVPGLPVFYVVSTTSSFYGEFLSGKWSPP